MQQNSLPRPSEPSTASRAAGPYQSQASFSASLAAHRAEDGCWDIGWTGGGKNK